MSKFSVWEITNSVRSRMVVVAKDQDSAMKVAESLRHVRGGKSSIRNVEDRWMDNERVADYIRRKKIVGFFPDTDDPKIIRPIVPRGSDE